VNISIFGLGYVGTVTAACLAGNGHSVVGVDVAEQKVNDFNSGISPVLEDGVEELLADAIADNRLLGTTDINVAIEASDVALICVGTPSRSNGDIDLTHIETVVAQIGAALASRERADRFTVVIRSTVMPGTAERAGAILEEHSGQKLGERVDLAVNPEFLREGQGVADFLDPPLILVGADNDASADVILGMYNGIDAGRRVVPVRVAELIKYANNSWHATKVTFANEIGVLSQALGIDGREVMDVVCSDEKLNISAAYLKPGFAFGGSCLPKDVRALNFAAKDRDIATPLLSSLLTSNAIQVLRLIDQLIEWDGRRIGFVGLAFKAGTDDLRESPIVEVVERMLGKGFDCRIYDADLSAGDLVGSNRAYIESQVPHLSKLLVDDVVELATTCDVLVVTKPSGELEAFLATPGDNPDQIVADLVGMSAPAAGREYHGVAW
jgi:GDP-mannose 6-dehydrogenase